MARDSIPFTILVSSTNTTLSGTHAYIPSGASTYATPLLFTADPSIPPTVFTLAGTNGKFAAQIDNTEVPVLWANVDSSNSYDSNVLFSDPTNGFNWVLCHQYTNYISCAVQSENDTRLSKLYVCTLADFGTFNDMALKIGNKVPAGCSAVQLNFTNVA